MKKFETGKTYQMRSVCDHDCTWEYKVIKRTNKTITLQATDEENAKPKRLTIRTDEYTKEEWVRPLGAYSFSPMLFASKEIR